MNLLGPRLRSWLLPSILLAASFLVYAGHLRETDRTGLVPRTIVRLSTPLLKAADSLFGGLRGAYRRYIKLVNVSKENEILRERVGQMEWELNSYREMALAQERYRKLFDFRFSSGFESLTARVIARDPGGWSSSLVLDRGKRDGVKRGLCVATDLGVVGQVIGVTEDACQVQTLLDPASSTAVLLQKSRTHAIASGQGEGQNLLLRFLDKSTVTEPAEVVVTSGVDGVFPHGLRVGIVTSIEKVPESLFQAVQVSPAVDLFHLEEVLILTNSADYLPPMPELSYGRAAQ
jgi:rod shape-determining protein MreC